MKLTEGTPMKATLKVIEIETDFKLLQKEFESLNNTCKLQETALKTQKEDNGKLERRIHLLEIDLGLERVTYGRISTRDYALKAFNQSTAKANWEGLGKHPVIEHIYTDIRNRSTEEGRRADDIMRKFENMPDWHGIMKEIGEHSEVQNLWSRVKDIDSNIAEIKDVQEVDRHNIYAKFGTQRDKNSDIETVLQTLEFLQSETGETMTSGFLFLIGAFATMKYQPTADGLSQILNHRKENPKDEKSSTDPKKQS